jgi:methionyl-tRNA synthetase
VGEAFPGKWPSLDGQGTLDILAPGRAVKAPDVLFRKIEDAQTVEWRERFGGPEGA